MTATSTTRATALEGARDMLPIVVGMAPFGLVAGIAAVEAGLPTWAGNAFSTIIFAGAAQLAALDLIGGGANPWVVVGTVAVINARFLMYSASLAVRFGGESPARRAVMAYLLTDQAYALVMTRGDGDTARRHGWVYYVGGAAPLWAAWQVYTLLGAVAGSVIPPDVPLGFAIPLVFAALLVPAVVDRATLAAACTSGVVAVLAGGLPANLGLLVAAGTGIAVGTALSRSAESDQEVAGA